MSRHKKRKKAAHAPAPPQAEAPAQQDAAHHTSKSYEELMYGFEEIRKILDNQDKFDKRKSTVNSCEEILKGFEEIKKIIDDQENPSG